MIFLIAKHRVKNYIIICYEALFRRLKEQYRNNKRLNDDDYSNHVAGFSGEKKADYTISFYPHKNSMIYQDLRLKNGPYAFQIDNLILSETFILIIENKHLAGELEYNSDSQQLVQKNGNSKKGYKSPIHQAATQKLHLLSWLQTFNFPLIPIETLVVLSNPATILENSQDDPSFFHKFIHLESLPAKLNELYGKYPQQVLDRNRLMQLNEFLLKSDTPQQPNLLTQYNIQEKHLINGIP